jgi:predicted O-methyltransferase YrrM
MHYPAHFGERTLKLLDEKISRNNPIGIEVGSFIGSSAVLLGDFLQAKGGSLICIDTWLGDINMWLLDRFSQTMGKDDGNPKIFQHFLDNIKDHSLERTIVPLRLPSLVAARMLKVLKWNVDFVYLDSAHEAGETFMELSLYWNLLRKGGILFGDDYNNFPAVKHDLDLFCRVIGQSPTFTGEGDTWILYK